MPGGPHCSLLRLACAWPLLAFAQLHVLDDVSTLRGLKLVAVAFAFVAAFATHW